MLWKQASPVRPTLLDRRQCSYPGTQSCSVEETLSPSRRTFNPADYKRQSFCSSNSSTKWMAVRACDTDFEFIILGINVRYSTRSAVIASTLVALRAGK